MSLSIYVGHSLDEAGTAFLWEFQANAAAHGTKVVLASYKPVASLTASRQAQIRAADAFLAVVTRPALRVEPEAKFAHQERKPIFVYIWQGVPFSAPAGSIVIAFNQGIDAPTLLADVANKLKPIAAKRGEGKTIAALIGAGAALFLLSLASTRARPKKPRLLDTLQNSSEKS